MCLICNALLPSELPGRCRLMKCPRGKCTDRPADFEQFRTILKVHGKNGEKEGKMRQVTRHGLLPWGRGEGKGRLEDLLGDHMVFSGI